MGPRRLPLSRGRERRIRFNGKERDEETGLYDYGARFYAPWLEDDGVARLRIVKPVHLRTQQPSHARRSRR